MALKLYKNLFNSTEADLTELSSTIDFICSNNLVQQIAKSKKLFFFLKKQKKIFLNVQSYISNSISTGCKEILFTKYGMFALISAI